eukprot:CAMPEP_0197187332 /NCGR_PEP_ID=MMETSP1423-20130617/15714_1 /TAXON_ID=476441 /ORGANISM="Pseudo-nitzschia heimii, Strain UNC1101" /LENGTH=207 /DNA_ID=CAMNT_0042638887 /DNA_START=224 /DNA_END=847 /DNA_ORIENTATION=-
MMYQQMMLDATIAPIPPSRTESRKLNTKQRSVMFSSSTKTSNGTEQRSAMKKMKRRATSSVPIPDAMFRSPSELQLSVDEQVADERDFVFYARLISGIRERTRAANPRLCDQHNYYNEETERCLTHIMQTRYQQEQEVEDDGVQILPEDDWIENRGSGGYYLEDLECCTSLSSSYSSSSTYQQDFGQHRNEEGNYYGESECIFDLEL